MGDNGQLSSKTLVDSDYSVKVYPLVCDRLTITCDMPEQLKPKIIKNFKDEKAKPLGGYEYNSTIWDLSMKLPPYSFVEHGVNDKVTSATIQCVSQFNNAAFMRLDFNPAKVNINELKSAVEINWLTISGYGFEYLLKNGKVTRIDFAVDIYSEQSEEYLYHYPKMQYVERVRSKSGCTEYIGAKAKTGKRVIVYDRLPAIKAHNDKKYKAKQKTPLPDKHIMRVEIKLSPYVSFNEVSKLPNPFEPFTIARKLQQKDDDPLWNVFIALARYEGVNTTLARIPKHKQPEFSNLLKKGTVAWWKPDFTWSQVQAVLDQISTA